MTRGRINRGNDATKSGDVFQSCQKGLFQWQCRGSGGETGHRESRRRAVHEEKDQKGRMIDNEREVDFGGYNSTMPVLRNVGQPLLAWGSDREKKSLGSWQEVGKICVERGAMGASFSTSERENLGMGFW